MNKYLLTTSILSAALVATPVVKAEESYVHGAAVDMSTKISKGRKLAELNYMQPFFAGENSLPIFDLKLKTDNYKSKEINAGLAYRHNVNDKAILGAYAYFDHRKTGNNFSVSGVTAGVELLSKYFDARANLYLPQNKRKKIVSNDTRAIEIKGNSIYAVSGGHTYESSFRGYDIEIGTPLFAFSDNLNEKFGTKVYAARYSFTAKGVKPITGTRFRIAQDIFKSYIGKNSYNLYANAETQYDNVRKRQNFVGVGVKISFGDAQNKHKKKSGLGYRMMETIVRDVDIVTQVESETPEIEDLYIGNNKITRVLYVESGNHTTGDGTANNPYSADHLATINHGDAVVVETGAVLPQAARHQLRNNGVHLLNGAYTTLETRGKNQISIVVDGTVDANPTISSPNRSVTEVRLNGQTASMANGAGRLRLPRPAAVARPVARPAAPAGGAMNPVPAPMPQAPNLNGGAVDMLALTTTIDNAHRNCLDAINEVRVAPNDNDVVARSLEAAQAAERAAFAAIGEILRSNPNHATADIRSLISRTARISEYSEAIKRAHVKTQFRVEYLSSGVQRADLGQSDRELYDLIERCFRELNVTNSYNIYSQREDRYNYIKAIVRMVPKRSDQSEYNYRRDVLTPIIQSDRSIVIAEQASRISTSEVIISNRIRRNDPAVNRDNAQRGMQHGSPQEKSEMAFLQSLSAKYGVLDGDRAVLLAKEFVLNAIKANVAALAHEGNVAQRARNAQHTAPSQAYLAALGAYLDNARYDGVPGTETDVDRQTREGRATAAKIALERASIESLSANNPYLAAYRALERSEDQGLWYNGSYYQEIAIGRYNDKEMLALALMAKLDVRTISENLHSSGVVVTPEAIFAEQKEGLRQFTIYNLGQAQRAYNIESTGVDIGGAGAVQTWEDNVRAVDTKPLADSPSCNHGYSVRIIRGISPLIPILTPQSFGEDLRSGLVAEFQALDPAEQPVVRDFEFPDNIEARVNNISARIEIINTDTGGIVQLPDAYSRILENVADDLRRRYRFAEPVEADQFVSNADAMVTIAASLPWMPW